MMDYRQMRIRGRVQGVGYRVFAAGVARALGLGGFVRNRIDGTVEVSAHGPKEMIDRFILALRQGPPESEVTEILEDAASAAPDPAPVSFTITNTV
jgi:acylphosphatase